MDKNVRIHWNLHKGQWSIIDKKTGLVVARQPEAFLEGVYIEPTYDKRGMMIEPKFNVRQGGRKRVIEEGKKNVHAFAVGTGGTHKGVATSYDGRPVTYNPYKNDTFVFADTGEPVTDVHVISVFTRNGRPEVYALPKSDSGLSTNQL